MKERLYHYKARVRSVYDGDTCRVDIDLGLKTWVSDEPVRLYRINAPELRGDEREQGLLARDFLRALIEGREVFIETVKDQREKYGRYLADIWLEQSDGTWMNVNDALVIAGHAVYRDY
jgi:micrococcal nuclease